MIELYETELEKITGGVSVWVVVGAVAGVIFGIGVIDGYVRPLKCRK